MAEKKVVKNREVFGGLECLVEKYRGKHDVWKCSIILL